MVGGGEEGEQRGEEGGGDRLLHHPPLEAAHPGGDPGGGGEGEGGEGEGEEGGHQVLGQGGGDVLQLAPRPPVPGGTGAEGLLPGDR